jgi:polysaccharide pyruvyl transferase WcaK-like protein
MKFDLDDITAQLVISLGSPAMLSSLRRHLSRPATPRYFRRGEKLKILFVGYNGKRNIGAEVRVCAMIEQFHHIFGQEHIDISLLTLNEEHAAIYFQGSVRLIPLNPVFFVDIIRACHQHDLVILSEGNCLMSNYANALPLLFCFAAGRMKYQGKPALAYGCEAGRMDSAVERAVKKLCPELYFIARSQPSLELVYNLGLKGHLGTDPGWTFTGHSREWAEQELRQKFGWDGQKKIIGIAPLNPFQWPIKPDLARLLRAKLANNWTNHYEKYFFFTDSSHRQAGYQAYCQAFAAALDWYCQTYKTTSILIAMDALDESVCRDIAARQQMAGLGIASGAAYNAYEITALLRHLDLLISSDYHARLLSMTAGVPSIAVAMDERLPNLLNECGHWNDYGIAADDPQLAEKLIASLEKLQTRTDQVSTELRHATPGYLKRLSDMGSFLYDYVLEKFPGLELQEKPRDWLGYIPPLGPELQAQLSSTDK